MRPEQVSLAKRNNVGSRARDRAPRPRRARRQRHRERVPGDPSHDEPRDGQHLRGHVRHAHPDRRAATSRGSTPSAERPFRFQALPPSRGGCSSPPYATCGDAGATATFGVDRQGVLPAPRVRGPRGGRSRRAAGRRHRGPRAAEPGARVRHLAPAATPRATDRRPRHRARDSSTTSRASAPLRSRTSRSCRSWRTGTRRRIHRERTPYSRWPSRLCAGPAHEGSDLREERGAAVRAGESARSLHREPHRVPMRSGACTPSARCSGAERRCGSWSSRTSSSRWTISCAETRARQPSERYARRVDSCRRAAESSGDDDAPDPLRHPDRSAEHRVGRDARPVAEGRRLGLRLALELRPLLRHLHAARAALPGGLDRRWRRWRRRRRGRASAPW